MKTTKTLYLILLFFPIILFNCSEEDNYEDFLIVEDYTQLKSIPLGEKQKKWNKSLEKIAIAFSKALSEEEFRTVVKEEALMQFDGDNEFLYKNVDERVVLSMNKKFKDHLSSSSKQIKSKNLKHEKGKEFTGFKTSFLDSTKELFPFLQIAVRGPVEKWDVENYHPLVTYMPVEFEDNWESIEAFDENGKTIKLNLIEEFEMPVIVIAWAERCDRSGNLLPEFDPKNKFNFNLKSSAVPAINNVISTVKLNSETSTPPSCSTPPTPNNLDAEVMEADVKITWGFYSSFPTAYTRFEIERKKSGGVWEQISSVSGSLREYFHPSSNYIANTTYYFRIRARYQSQQGYCYGIFTPSTSIVTGDLPESIPEFTAYTHGQNHIGLSWDNLDGFWDYVVIDRTSAGEPWTEISKSFNSSTPKISLDEMTQKAPGKAYTYRIRVMGAWGLSDPTYAVERNSWRTDGEQVILSHIRIRDLNAIESQIAGKPEMGLRVATVNSPEDIGDGDNHVPFYLFGPMVQDDISRSTWINGWRCNYYIGNWTNLFHKKVMTFHMWEKDFGIRGDLDIKCEVGKAVKAEVSEGHFMLSLDVEGAPNIKIEIDADKGDNDCGHAYTPFWAKRPVTISLPKDGAILLRIDQNPVLGDWVDSWDGDTDQGY